MGLNSTRWSILEFHLGSHRMTQNILQYIYLGVRFCISFELWCIYEGQQPHWKAAVWGYTSVIFLTLSPSHHDQIFALFAELGQLLTDRFWHSLFGARTMTFSRMLFRSTSKMERMAVGPKRHDRRRRQAPHTAGCLDPEPHRNNRLPAGITFVSVTLFFIYFGRWILKMVYVPGPKQTLRGYASRNHIGSAYSWSSLSFVHPHPHSLYNGRWTMGHRNSFIHCTK